MRSHELILGINKGSTLRDKTLRSGGAAIAVDGEIKFAITEERATDEKWAGGYEHALEEACKSVKKLLDIKWNLTPSDFAEIAVSTCCEGEAAIKKGILYRIFRICALLTTTCRMPA